METRNSFPEKTEYDLVDLNYVKRTEGVYIPDESEGEERLIEGEERLITFSGMKLNKKMPVKCTLLVDHERTEPIRDSEWRNMKFRRTNESVSIKVE